MCLYIKDCRTAFKHGLGNLIVELKHFLCFIPVPLGIFAFLSCLLLRRVRQWMVLHVAPGVYASSHHLWLVKANNSERRAVYLVRFGKMKRGG